MSTPNVEIYCFEDHLERAISSYLLANGINDPVKQRDDSQLLTPRVEVKSLFNGFTPDHYAMVPTADHWLDIALGTLYLKVVTRRDDPEQSHSRMRGMCRWLMQNPGDISQRMEFHTLARVIENGSTPDVQAQQYYDLSTLSFEIWLKIRDSAFPKS